MNFEEYLKENKKEFTEKVNNICTELRIEANWLMFVMWFESKLNPQAVNPISGATGLIQLCRVLPVFEVYRRFKADEQRSATHYACLLTTLRAG